MNFLPCRFGRSIRSAVAASFALALALSAGAAEAKKARVKIDDRPIAREDHVITSFAPIANKTASNVVSVYTKRTTQDNEGMDSLFNNPLFRRFFGGGDRPPQARPRLERSLGSGVIVTEDGYLLTNSHVVDGAEEIAVVLASGAEYPAKLVGADPPTDIAVLKIEATDLPAATLADSSKLKVGDVVLAIGNPFGVGQTVTMGIVSAMQRSGFGIVDYEDFIQTDASVNPGSSGGALVDVEGRVIGINTAIVSRTGGSQGIGFAVPINMARSVMDEIIETGKVTRGYLGIYIQPLSPELAKAFNLQKREGALVAGVMSDSPAADAGIKDGDVIVDFNGKKVTDSRSLRLMAAQTHPNTEVKVGIIRDGKPQTVTMQLKELPAEHLAGQAAPQKEGAGSARRNEFLPGVELGELNQEARQQLDIPKNVSGVEVADVAPDSAAYGEGLRPGDIIMEVNRKPVRSMREAVVALRGAKEASTLLRVWSEGGMHYLVVPAPAKSPAKGNE